MSELFDKSIFHQPLPANGRAAADLFKVHQYSWQSGGAKSPASIGLLTTTAVQFEAEYMKYLRTLVMNCMQTRNNLQPVGAQNSRAAKNTMLRECLSSQPVARDNPVSFIICFANLN